MSLPERMAYRWPGSGDTWIRLGNRVSNGAEVWARSLTFIRRKAHNIIGDIPAVVGKRVLVGTPENSVLEALYAVVLALTRKPIGISSDKVRRESWRKGCLEALEAALVGFR